MMVADTDVLIDYLRGSPQADRVAVDLVRGLATTVVSRFELLAGARSERQQRAVETLLAALTTLDLDSAAAGRAAAIRRDLAARGAEIGMADCLIAGICLERGAILLTRNRKHFDRVEGLALG
jgi:tRNA(fMet)-specific endonuclease VapC